MLLVALKVYLMLLSHGLTHATTHMSQCGMSLCHMQSVNKILDTACIILTQKLVECMQRVSKII